MHKHLSIRIKDHQVFNGVQEYSVEVTLPGEYNKILVGTSQADLISQLVQSFGEIMTDLDIPLTVSRQQMLPLEEAPTTPKFFTADGKPQPISGFAATAKAAFAAQIIRDGKVVED